MSFAQLHNRRSRATRKSHVAALGLSLAAGAFGCATDANDGLGGAGGSGSSSTTTTVTVSTGSTSTSATMASGTGGTGGMSLCAMDCSQLPTGECLKAVCNDGSYPGQIGSCVAVPDEGATCDDETFCTTNDTCDKDGKCVGGPPNDCGMTPGECKVIQCNENSSACVEVGAFVPNTPCTDGSECTSGSCTANKCDPPACVASDLCTVNAVCNATGQCVGTPKDCSFSPLIECNAVACNPANGKCEGAPDTTKNGAACQLSGDLCNSGKTCMAGACQGGTPKDCSALTQDCTLGVCNAANGACQGQPIAPGGMCDDATDECNQGFCDNMGMCIPMPIVGVSCPSAVDECHTGTCNASGQCGAVQVSNGMPCNDHDACTASDSCTNGTCAGAAVGGCQTYYNESFETCPAGWTYTGEWQCGAPVTVISGAEPPTGAQTGSSVIGTNLAGKYALNDAYATNTATSPIINLTTASQPVLSFYMWVDTEKLTFGLYDGANLRISIDGGAFNLVGSGANCTAANACTPITLTKQYDEFLAGSQPAWGGQEAAQGWQHVTADLTSFVGHQVQLRYSFRSDGSTNYSGVYIDTVSVQEANAVPLDITTSTLTNGSVNQAFTANLVKVGGSTGSVWSIVPGGVNTSWLSINSSTGQLTGTPSAANAGPVTVTVRVEEPSLPSNFDERTYSFNIGQTLYSQGFEGACPNGWTLTGDWQCGVPASVGPPTAFAGSQCLATVINGDYNDNQAYATTTATSPSIALTMAPGLKVTWKAWVDEEPTFDAYNILVSTNGGATFTQLTGVSPAYNGTVASQQSWSSETLSWQNYEANLSAYAGQSVLLRFAFRSDGSGTQAGVYIDDLVVLSD